MESISLLLIEDNPADARWLQSRIHLEPSSSEFYITWVNLLQTGLQQLAAASYAAVLLDLDLPDSRGLDTLAQVRSQYPACPIVVLAGETSGDIGAQVINSGAQDYLVKGKIDGNDIILAVRHAIERKHFELDLERRAREMEALYETSLEINAQVNLGPLLRALVERAARLMGLPMGGLYLLQPDDDSLRLEHVYNLDQEYRGVTLKLGEGLSGRVAQTGQPLAVSDYSQWEGRAGVYAGAEFRRVLAVPLRAGGRIIGVINLGDNQRSGAWSQEEIRLASLFADQAAIAIQNARLLETERQKGADLARSNAVIAALIQVAGRLGETLDPAQILETLGNELKKLGVFVQLSLFQNDPAWLVVQYTSVDRAVLEQVENFLGQKLIGFRIPQNVWPLEKQMDQRKSFFLIDPLPLVTTVFSKIPPSIVEIAFAHLGVTHQTPVIYLPLVIKDQPLGMMAVWGSNLREDDVSAYTVFANQVAVALENARLYNRIERLATLDELTGLYNRRGFFLLAEQHLQVARRINSDVLLVFIDVDQLKHVNDTFGHKEGDQALVKTAEALRATFRAADILARISGDEFAVLAYSTKSLGAEMLMERLAHEISHINARNIHPFTLSLSAGYTVWSPLHPLSLDELLAHADAQMYQVKRKKTTGELRDMLDRSNLDED
jgi:diguanylate cyclase (GGDEF)-like protein